MQKDHLVGGAGGGVQEQPTLSAAMRAKEFRAELVKIMPGYEWTVHKTRSTTHLEATGTQASGFNRISTLSVTRVGAGKPFMYEAKSAGYGLRAKWGAMCVGRTLAQALRSLQDHYIACEANYRSLAARLQEGRTTKGGAA